MGQQENKQVITLCMIVKNESEVIVRGLESVRNIVDHVCICDTGSTDGTQDLIREYLKKNKISGKVFDKPWKDFGHNRTECFTLGKETYADTDYLMTLDADEVIVPVGGHAMDAVPMMDSVVSGVPFLTSDIFYITTFLGNIKYNRPVFFKASLGWKWEGVLHEYAYSDESGDYEYLDSLCNVARPEGSRSKQTEKYVGDIKVLKDALKEDPENGRHWFYLAQTYADCGKYKASLEPLEKAIKYSAWDEEKFICLLRRPRYKIGANMPFEEVVSDYLEAYQFAPHRAEPLYDLISYYRVKDQFYTAALFLDRALSLPYPGQSVLLTEPEVYQWKLFDEASLVYYYTGFPDRALYLAQDLLQNPYVPDETKERIKTNLSYYKQAVAEQQQRDRPQGANCCGAETRQPKKSIVL